MNVLAGLEAVLLALIAGLHVAWGLGERWPARDEKALAALVVGYRLDRMPSPVQCFAAAVAILAAAAMVALLAINSQLSGLMMLVGAGVTAVFTARGVAGYLPAWRTRFPRQPFATFDRRLYSPLCLVIAATCAILLLNPTS